MKITPIIGIEVHVELTTKSKMFCGCPADHFGKEPNSETCPVCLGLPGALPVPNQKAIEDTIMIGLALNCGINEHTHFDRKQYFYPDLAKGYQISQYDQPLCHDGKLTLNSGKVIRLERIHLEEDTAKLQHESIDGKKVSLIDFNRGGVPLVEIVSQADLSTADEAKEYLKKIHEIVRELGVSSADMEKGQMRLEPTVNLKIENEKGEHFTPLVELKNINSFNFAHQAITFEVGRQLKEWEETGAEKTKTNKTTRGYDSERKITFPQREKEEAKDYRYFPEPDIPPLRITLEIIERIKDQMPQLPEAQIATLVELGIEEKYAKLLYADKEVTLLLIESAKDKEINVSKLANFIANKKIDVSIDIKSQYAKLTQMGETDETKLGSYVDQVIAENPKVVEEYQKGKTGVLGFFVGAVIKLSQGKADPKTVSKLLVEKLTAKP